MRQRKRHPLDVPAKVAVALADFCRRAGAVVDPRTVRDALSLLEASQDERVLKLAATEPLAKPLGPFAVVEILETNASAHEVAQRQSEGAYAQVDLKDVEEQIVSSPSPPPQPSPQASASEKKPRRPKQTLESRVAPKVRRAGDPAPPPPARIPAPRASPRYAAFKKRDLPKGRGRFTRVDVMKAKLHKLLEPHMKEELEQLIAQHGHRVALKRALDPIYFGKKGEALTVADIEGALLHHELRTLIAEREKQLVIAAVTEARGDLHRAGLTLGMRDDELDHIVLNSGALSAIEQIREHHAREALAHGNLRLKLDLIDQPKYLANLGVEKRFRDALAVELSELLDASLAKAADVDALVREAARQSGLPHEKLKAAVDRTGLSAAYRRRLAVAR